MPGGCGPGATIGPVTAGWAGAPRECRDEPRDPAVVRDAVGVQAPDERQRIAADGVGRAFGIEDLEALHAPMQPAVRRPPLFTALG